MFNFMQTHLDLLDFFRVNLKYQERNGILNKMLLLIKLDFNRYVYNLITSVFENIHIYQMSS